MELLLAVTLGVLTSCGIYLLLRARTFPVVVGLIMLSYAVTLFLFAMGRLSTGASPVIGRSESYADPLPQALVLTAIVIGFAMTAFALALALRGRGELDTDHVDGGHNDTGHSDPRHSEIGEQR